MQANISTKNVETIYLMLQNEHKVFQPDELYLQRNILALELSLLHTCYSNPERLCQLEVGLIISRKIVIPWSCRTALFQIDADGVSKVLSHKIFM